MGLIFLFERNLDVKASFMKKHILLTLSILTGAALVLPAAAQAQAPKPAIGASAAKHAAEEKHGVEKKREAGEKPAMEKKPVVEKKHVAKKPVRKTKKGVPLKTAKAVEAQTPVQTLSDRLTDAELQTARQIYTGTFPCELGERVTVTADEANPGFFNVMSGKRRYYMHPVESSTGAIRMEDNRRGAVWLQLANKSELLDQKLGQRVADNCEATAQKDYAVQMQDHPQQHLFDMPTTGQQTGRPADHSASAPAEGAQPADHGASAP